MTERPRRQDVTWAYTGLLAGSSKMCLLFVQAISYKNNYKTNMQGPFIPLTDCLNPLNVPGGANTILSDSNEHSGWRDGDKDHPGVQHAHKDDDCQ